MEKLLPASFFVLLFVMFKSRLIIPFHIFNQEDFASLHIQLLTSTSGVDS